MRGRSSAQPTRLPATSPGVLLSGGLDDQHRALGLVRHSIRNAAEHAALHPLVADNEQIGGAFRRKLDQHLRGVALVYAGLTLDAGASQVVLGALEDRSHTGRRTRFPLKLDVAAGG